MDRWKSRWEESEKKEKKRRSEKRKSRKKEHAGGRKGRKVQITAFFRLICGPGGSKSRLAKAAGAEPSGQMRDEKIARRCGAKHISKSNRTKHTRVVTVRRYVLAHRGPEVMDLALQELHKSIRFGALLEVEMAKKCTPLWREAHVEVKRYKTPHVRSTFGSWDVEKVHAVVGRNTFRSQNAK